MSLVGIGFYFILLVFGFVFINRTKILKAYKFIGVQLIFALGILMSLDAIFDNGFGYSTPIEIEISNKTSVSLYVYGVLQNDYYCGNSSYVYSFGKLKLDGQAKKTLEADCGKEFLIFAFDENDKPVFIHTMNIENDETVEIASFGRLDQAKTTLFLKYKNKLMEFKAKEQQNELYKIGIIFFLYTYFSSNF